MYVLRNLLQFELIFGRDSCQYLGKNPQTHPRRPQGLGHRLQIQRGEYLKQTLAALFFSKYSEMGIFSKKSSENSEIGIFIKFLRENSEIGIFSAKFIQIFRNGNFCFADILPTKNRLLLEVQKLLASTCFCFVFILYAKTH